jgi:hypothetical protein
VAVERIGVDHGLVARDGGGPVAVRGVEGAELGFAVGQNFLHLAQLLAGVIEDRLGRVGYCLSMVRYSASACVALE